MARNILNDYGDGVAEIYRKKDVEKNVKSLDDLDSKSQIPTRHTIMCRKQESVQ